MAVFSDFNISTLNDTSQLNLVINGVTTTYEYDNGNVTLSERLNTEQMSLDEFSQKLTFMDTWIEQIRKLIRPAVIAVSFFNDEIKKDATKIECLYQVTENITSSEYDPNTSLIDLAPRDEITVNFATLINWFQFLRRYEILCKNF